MKKILTTGLVILMVVALPAMTFAASPWVDKATYGEKVTGKLTYGLENTLFGWTEMFRKPYEAIRDEKNILPGFGYGILNTVTYTVGGILHTATFPVPQIDVPIPNDGVKF